MAINQKGPLLIYGAGACGQSVAQYLLRNHFEIEAFLDKDPKVLKIDGIPVIQAGEYLAQQKTERQIIVGLNNHKFSIKEVIENLKQYPLLKIVSLWEFKNQFSDVICQHPDFFIREKDKPLANEAIEKIYPMLADQMSRDILKAIFKFRTSGNYDVLPAWTDDQYVPNGLPKWPKKLRYIDCGAYIGDTITLLGGHQYEFESIAAFEPDLNVFEKLVITIKDKPCIAFPCGVGSQNKNLQFEKSIGGGSHLSISGSSVTTIVKLDDVLPNFKPNFIKMDIEGAEREALKGAENMIKKYRPALSIDLEHRPDDLWVIPAYLKNLDLEYDFYIRSHNPNSFDTVLYAIPRN